MVRWNVRFVMRICVFVIASYICIVCLGELMFWYMSIIVMYVFFMGFNFVFCIFFIKLSIFFMFAYRRNTSLYFVIVFALFVFIFFLYKNDNCVFVLFFVLLFVVFLCIVCIVVCFFCWFVFCLFNFSNASSFIVFRNTLFFCVCLFVFGVVCVDFFFL